MKTATIPGAITRNQLIDQLVNGKLTAMYEDMTAVHVTRDNMKDLQRIVIEQQQRIEVLEAENKRLNAEANRLAARILMLEDTLLPFARQYANVRQHKGQFMDVTMPTKHFEAAARALELTP